MAVAALLIADAPALAQCAMCKMAAGAQGTQAAQAMNMGILLLLIPPVLIFCAIFFFALRFGNAQEHSPSIANRLRTLLRRLVGLRARG